MCAGNARMLRLMVSGSALFAWPVYPEGLAYWNPLTHFWVSMVHHRYGVERFAVMRWA